MGDIDIGEEYAPIIDLAPPPANDAVRQRGCRLHAHARSNDIVAIHTIDITESHRPTRESPGSPCQHSTTHDGIECEIGRLARLRMRSEWTPGLVPRALLIGLGYMVGGNSYNSPNWLRIMLIILMAIMINEFALAMIKLRRAAFYTERMAVLERMLWGDRRSDAAYVPAVAEYKDDGNEAFLLFGRPRRWRVEYSEEEGSREPHQTLATRGTATDAEIVEKLYGLFERFSLIVRYFSVTAVTYAVNETLKKLFYGADELVGITLMITVIFVVSEAMESLTDIRHG